MLAAGQSNKQVGTVLKLGLSTERPTRANLMQRLNLHITAETVCRGL